MIQFARVKKQFSAAAVPALDGVSLTIAPGEFCVLLGENGAGKSTFLKLISGQEDVTEGTVRCGGGVAQVVQDVAKGTVGDMRVIENLALSFVSAKGPRFRLFRRYESDIRRLVKELGRDMETLLQRPMHTLSGGQRQIFAVLMAIAAGKPILLLDEPTSALDVEMEKRFMAYTLKKVQEQGLTVVMITHRLEDAVRPGVRVLGLRAGQVVLDHSQREGDQLALPQLKQIFGETS